MRLAEPEEVNAEWKRWSCTLLKPDGLYPTRPAADRNKPSKLKAIAMALKICDQVILATDCDREGQLIAAMGWEPENQFAADSPLEGGGFEPSVPLAG